MLFRDINCTHRLVSIVSFALFCCLACLMPSMLAASTPLATTSELIASRGFPTEVHKTVTEDGYILSLHRISNNLGKPPVLIMHGLLAASDLWVVMKPEFSLPFILADAGYDVWLADGRGNAYSKSHVQYSTKEKKFWDFTFHESGIYDIPAFIDYVLNSTGFKQLFYIGHSMGTTVFLVMASTRPEYNSKIKAAALLAPVATVPKEKYWGSLTKISLNISENTYRTLMRNRVYEMLPRSVNLVKSVQTTCRRTPNVCFSALKHSMGENRKNWDLKNAAHYFSYFPAGTSVKTVHHIMQVFKQDRFAMHDLGAKENFIRYGTSKPPLYNLKNVTSPIALFSGLNDKFSNVESTNALAQLLPNVIMNHVAQDPKYCHADFLIGINTREVVTDYILQAFNGLSKI